MIPFRSGSCLSKLEHVKANSREVIKIIDNYHITHCNFNTLALFAFTRFYLRVLADGNGIILRLKRNVILRKPINSVTIESTGYPRTYAYGRQGTENLAVYLEYP
jgi:hypothetical protein